MSEKCRPSYKTTKSSEGYGTLGTAHPDEKKRINDALKRLGHGPGQFMRPKKKKL